MLARMSAAPGCRRPLLAVSRPLLAVLALLLLSLAVPPSAPAAGIEGGNSFSELSRKAEEEEPSTETAATTKNAESETHNSSKTILIGVGAAIVLLLAIGYVIVRDARRVAPAGAEDVAEGRRGRDAAGRRHNRRAKAKAARQQRKRNR
jgi:hypothetical protein